MKVACMVCKNNKKLFTNLLSVKTNLKIKFRLFLAETQKIINASKKKSFYCLFYTGISERVSGVRILPHPRYYTSKAF